jgi:hypothetical protein
MQVLRRTTPWRLRTALSIIPALLAAGSISPVVADAAPSPAWSEMTGAPPGSTLDALSGHRNDLWAVGRQLSVRPGDLTDTLAQHYDGSSWVSVPTPDVGYQDELLGVSEATKRNVWSVGFSFDGSTSTPLAFHWNGASWSDTPLPATGDSKLTGVVSINRKDAWAVGWERGATTALIEHWNGSMWTFTPSPDVGVPVLLQGIAADGPNDIWAVGYTGIFAQSAIVEHYDGTAWSVVPSASPGAGINILYGVTKSGSNIWAVGTYGDGSTGDHTLTEMLAGASFVQVPSPNVSSSPQSILTSVSGHGSNLWAAGSYDSRAEPTRP